MTNDEIKKIEEQIAKNKEKIKELKKKKKLVLNKEQELKEKKILAMIKKIYNIESEQNFLALEKQGKMFLNANQKK